MLAIEVVLLFGPAGYKARRNDQCLQV